MSIPNLPVNFKDDILAASNPKRKYQQTFNPDGSVSLEDVTVYTQQGSDFGASQVNQTNGAINNIYNERILDLDELELVTEPGFFVDAQAAKEAYDTLNSNKPSIEEVYSATGIQKNLASNQPSSYVFEQIIEKSGFAYVEVNTNFPAGNNRKRIVLKKNDDTVTQNDFTCGTSGVSAWMTASAMVPVSAGDVLVAQLLCATAGMTSSNVRITGFFVNS